MYWTARQFFLCPQFCSAQLSILSARDIGLFFWNKHARMLSFDVLQGVVWWHPSTKTLRLDTMPVRLYQKLSGVLPAFEIVHYSTADFVKVLPLEWIMPNVLQSLLHKLFLYYGCAMLITKDQLLSDPCIQQRKPWSILNTVYRSWCKIWSYSSGIPTASAIISSYFGLEYLTIRF